MNELVHMALEGLFAVLLAVTGFFLRSLWSEIKDVRDDKERQADAIRNKIENLKETIAALELRMEREFVKHSDLTWIKDKLEKFEEILSQIQLAMARHRRADDAGAGE